MRVYEGIWRYMKVYEGIWAYMKVYEGIWWYMRPIWDPYDLKSGRAMVPNLPLLSVKYVCLISQETNHPILIPKTVLKSVLWRHSESALAFCIFQLLCFSLRPSIHNACIHDACIHDTYIHDACIHGACIYVACIHDECFHDACIHVRMHLSLIHIWRCRRIERCRSRWSPYH